jgi:DNA-binding transcriptional ArsR family regulator
MPPQEPTDELRALAHPLRLRLLSLLTNQPMSAAEAARELAESQANISYHLRRLHAVGLLDLAEEVSVRGGRAKRYRHDPESGNKVAAGTVEEHQLMVSALTAELRRRTAQRVLGAPSATTDAEVWVDPAVWRLALDKAHGVSMLLHDNARRPHAPGAVRVAATMVLFQLTEEAGK